MAMSVITGGQSPLQGCLNSYLTDKPSVVKAKKAGEDAGVRTQQRCAPTPAANQTRRLPL
jgi:hypothetical protein